MTKKLTLYNKKKKQWGWYKREANERGVSSVLLGWLRIALLVCESEDKEQTTLDRRVVYNFKRSNKESCEKIQQISDLMKNVTALIMVIELSGVQFGLKSYANQIRGG